MPVYRQAARKKGRVNRCRRTTTRQRSGGGAGWLLPFSFQFFTCLAAVFEEEVGGFSLFVFDGQI
jgi:hypothetical protein